MTSQMNEFRIKRTNLIEGGVTQNRYREMNVQSLIHVIESLQVPPELYSPFPQRSYFCVTSLQDVYLAYQDNESPALNFDIPPVSSDSLALFIFDLDAPISGLLKDSDGWRGSAPAWVNVTSPSEIPSHLIKRAPFLLWAMNDLDRQLTEIPAGLGGVGLSIKGKSPGRVRFGQSWYNDYSTWFTSSAISGKYYGYDGPCVSWNDPLVQHRIQVVLLSLKYPLQLSDYSVNSPSASGWSLFRQALLASDAYATGIWLTQRPMDMMPSLNLNTPMKD